MKGKKYRRTAMLALMAILIMQVFWMVNTLILYQEQGTIPPQELLLTFFDDNWLLILSTILTNVAVVIGITEHLRHMEQNEQMNQIRSDFTSAMIHDMKSPLSSIIMGVRALQSGKLDAKPEIKARYFRIVEEEAGHLLALTNRMLTIAKLEDERLMLAKTSVELEPMLQDIFEKYGAKVQKPMHTELHLQVTRVWADAEYLKETLINLTDNAVKYSRDDIRISVTSRQEGHFVVVSVRDEGIGIAREELPTIFNKFERAAIFKNKANPHVAGFGLGLNYVYHVMQTHGGSVKASSQKGRYTQIDLYFPNDQTTNSPNGQTTNPPNDQTTNSPNDQTTNSPNDQTTNPPNDQTTNPPNDQLT